nr:hypothetical protein [Tanacetum cinerariifolium]
MVERQFTTKLKNVQTDRGGEFRNLASFFSSLGIIHRRSCPHTSERNGFVERRNRHVVETSLTLLAQAHVPQCFWHYAFDTVVYLINRMPSRTSTSNSSFEHIFKRSPDYSFLRVFGCLCFPHLRLYNRHKMDFRSTPCVFLGYRPSHHGYLCLDISIERLYIARHVRFNEAQFPFDIPKTTSPPPLKTSPYYSSESSYVIPTTDHLSPSSPCLPISSPSSVLHLSLNSQTSPKSSNGQSSPVSTTSIPTPPPPTPPSPPITQLHEYDALMKNGTWSLVPRDSNTNVVAGKWIYMLKRDKNGTITRYKARFVAKGFRQQADIDFHGTFSPVVKSTTIQAVLSLAVTNDWPLRQLDIQNAFLYVNLKGQVYMKQPPGFIDPQRPNHVCLLHKSLYGLKQAPCAWFERLSKALFDLGFKGSKTDPSLFIYSRGDTPFYILVYVNDIIVTCNNKGTIDNIICQLGSAFALKDLGPLNYFLGIEIVSHVFGILLSQKKYILELLQSVGLSNCNLVSSPMVTSSSLDLDDNTTFFNPVKYRQVVGYLQYVTLSQPDIAFVVNKALAEITWLQALLNELGIRSSSTPILRCDNLGEPITVLKQHRRPPQAKESLISMANVDDQPTGQDDLATKVDKLTRQLQSVIGWIQAQPSSRSKALETPIVGWLNVLDAKKNESLQTSGLGHKDPKPISIRKIGQFIINGYLDLRTPMKERYDGFVTDEEDDDTKGEYIFKKPNHGSHNPFKVEARIDIPTKEKVIFALLKLTSHALAWLNSMLKNLSEEVNRKIQTEMRLHKIKNISEASGIAMAIELKNKSSSQKLQEGSKGEGSSRGESKKDFRKTASMQSANENKYCSNCRITGHTKESCWKKDMDTQVNQQFKFRFAITNRYVDEVTCEVVPLDICQVIFRSPYLWELNAVYLRRAQKYQFEKDGQKYLVERSTGSRNVEFITACQARRLVNASQVLLLILLWPMESSNKVSALTLSSSYINNKLENVIAAFPTLFEDICHMPPNQVIEHDIQLIVDSTLPNIDICTWKDHINHVQKVFQLLQQEQLRLNLKKCKFGKKQLTYLGFVVGNGEFQVDPEKRKISEAPVLALPNLQRPSELETDASGYAMGAVWFQEGKPIAYHSEMFRGAQKNYPTYVEELLALHQEVQPSSHDEYAFEEGSLLGTLESPRLYKTFNESGVIYTTACSISSMGKHLYGFSKRVPKTRKGNQYLFVIVDRFSKMVVLIPCKKTVTGEEAARLFFENSNMDTKLKRSTTFHPQTDGQTEVVNRTVVHLLRGYNSKHTKTWDESVHFLQFAINHAIHSSTGKSPSEVCLGFLPQTLFDLEFTTDSMLAPSNEVGEARKAHRFISNIRKLHHKVEEQLRRSQQKYKERHDRHRVKGNFQEELPAYMEMYLVVSVDKLKLFEPSMLDKEPGESLPAVEDITMDQEKILSKDTIVERKTSSTRRGERKSYRIEKKGSCPALQNKNHREEEYQEGNNLLEIETLTYHVLATYGLNRSSYLSPLFSLHQLLIKMFPRRSKGEELEYPFFEGDGSSFDEWRDYGVAGDDYEGPSIFDDDQFEDELEMGDDAFC